MNRSTSNLGPALALALAVLAASALTVAFPRELWTALAAPAILVLALIGTDLARRRRSGRPLRPSPRVWILAGAIVVASAILAGSAFLSGGDLDDLAAMIPILAGCAALPLTQEDDREEACRRSTRRAPEAAS
jgi:hypothetical protein